LTLPRLEQTSRLFHNAASARKLFIPHVSTVEMTNVTENDPTGSTPPEEESALSRQEEPDTSEPPEDPGYLTETGEAVGEDGSVAPIIGGLPAVGGSAWDIGAPLDERGAGLADEQASRADQASHEDTGSN
jgi:hypothetical protein